MVRGVVLVAMLAAVAPAFAEDIVAYEVEGEASAAAGDPRSDALDDAFAHAIATALGELVAPDARAAKKAELDREIVGHARKWITKFSVTRDDTSDGRRQLAVAVRVDRDKLRARLGELGVAVGPAVPVVAPTGPTSRGAAIVMTGSWPDGATDPPAALVKLLRDAKLGVRVARRAAQPVDDAAAAAIAIEAKADVVAIVAIERGKDVPVRGVAATAALVSAHVRVVDRDGKLVGDATAAAASIDRAVAAAAVDALPPQAHPLAQADTFTGDDVPVAEPGIVLVRLAPATPWRLVAAEQKYLAGTRGVRAVALRRLSPRGWVLGVRTDATIDQIAVTAKRAPTADASVGAVKVVGDVLDVTLAGTP